MTAILYAFSVQLERRADGAYVITSTRSPDGTESVTFGPYEPDDALELSADFRKTCLALGAVEIPPGAPN